MGCDIHLFIEYKTPNYDSWMGFGEQFRLDRDYSMFCRMAGVRQYGDEIKPITEPRGIPTDLGWKANDENRLFIVDRDEAGESEATRDQAERWVKSGCSKMDGENYVTHPDWHSHSWLTSDEYETCVNTFSDISVEYKAVLAALRCFEAAGHQTRVVFWFDN